MKLPLRAADRSPTTQAQTDEELVAIAHADPLAFVPLYQRYLERIYRYCHIKLGDREVAEDATSEVFLKAFANLHHFRGRVFAAWLYTIARNVVIDHLRQRRPSEPLEAADRYQAAREAGGDAERQRALVSAALAELPDEQRAILELQFAGWSGQEIAAALGKSPAAVRKARQRAVERLRGLLGPDQSQEVSDAYQRHEPGTASRTA
ncbi:MAG TPA: sigma-70 family RNA polymerase sigma factor [Anaerolineae bacterium]|nr:sigma-70 family RNA polymerase sigma factor [Anaerolineae bacterium]HPL29319.1 sigma-70 family RNA polymerase sigma factor [Anaerolineae bacterium]